MLAAWPIIRRDEQANLVRVRLAERIGRDFDRNLGGWQRVAEQRGDVAGDGSYDGGRDGELAARSNGGAFPVDAHLDIVRPAVSLARPRARS